MIDFLNPNKFIVDNNCLIKVIHHNRRRGLYEIYKKDFTYTQYGTTYEWIRIKVIEDGSKKDLFTQLEVINFINNYKKDKYNLILKDWIFKKFYIAKNKEEKENEEYFFCPIKRGDKK